jgi:Domain of unknown function (DUF1996)
LTAAKASRLWRVRVVAFVALIAAAVSAAVGVLDGDGTRDPAPARDHAAVGDDGAVGDGPIGDKGWFHSDCRFSHRAPDDPIVFPAAASASHSHGHAAAAHSHDFIGSGGTSSSSTNASLRADPRSTCERGDEQKDPSLARVDRSGYWAPTLMVGGEPLAPDGVTAGYGVGRRDPSRIQPYPADLKVIAGSQSGAGPRVGSAFVYRVRCGSGPPVSPGSRTTAPTCRTPDLRVDINFPDCSNGRADSADHKAHMAYSQPAADGSGLWVCPSTHPILVPRLSLRYRFATTGGPDVAFVTGDMSTTHADFMNGWDEGRLAQLIRACLHVDKYCGASDAPVHE